MEIEINYTEPNHIIGSTVQTKITTINTHQTFVFLFPQIVEITRTEFKDFRKTINDLKNLITYGTFDYSFEAFNFYAKSNDEMKLISCYYEFSNRQITNNRNLKNANYNLEYLSKIFNQLSSKHSILLVFENDKPLLIMQKELTFAIAPMVID